MESVEVPDFNEAALGCSSSADSGGKVTGGLAAVESLLELLEVVETGHERCERLDGELVNSAAYEIFQVVDGGRCLGNVFF